MTTSIIPNTKSFTPKLIGGITCSGYKNIGEKMSFDVTITNMKLVYEDWDNENDCPDEYMFHPISVNFESSYEDILDENGNITNSLEFNQNNQNSVKFKSLDEYIWDEDGNITKSLEFTITGWAKDDYNYMNYYDIAITCSFDTDGIKIKDTIFKPNNA